MSVHLNVFVIKLPKNLRDRWQDALAVQGMSCEFRPDFDPDTWSGSDLVAKLTIAPGGFKGAERYGSVPFFTGCGMDLYHAPEFEEQRSALLVQCKPPICTKLAKATQKFSFFTSMNRTTEAWRLQVFAAATLAQVTGGLFYDPQTSAFSTGDEAVKRATAETALEELEAASRLKPGQGCKVRPFRTWRAALKHAIPEYTEA